MNKIKFILLQSRKNTEQDYLIRIDKIQLIQENKMKDGKQKGKMIFGSTVFLSGPVSRIEVWETPEEILKLIKEK